MTRAYHTGSTLVVGSLAYSTVIFASLWGILLWQEILPLGSWLAIALIIVSGVISLRSAPKLPAV
jgi:drug/metabolite transporter (DMT)-like permease